MIIIRPFAGKAFKFNICALVLFTIVFSACVPAKVIQRSPDALRAMLEPGIKMTKPNGIGPHPAVFLMHGAGDPVWREGYGDWMKWLNEQGHVAAFIDSVTVRGVSGESLMTGTLMSRERAADVFIALEYLRGQEFIDGERIAVIGFSHGADSALDALVQAPPAGPLEALTEVPHKGLEGLCAVVAFYPGCRKPVMGYRVTEVYDRSWVVKVPVLILQGGADTFVDIELCQKAVERQKRVGTPVEYVFYPGTPHCFDAIYTDNLDDPNCYMVPDKARDARNRVKKFLKLHLGK